MNPDRYSKTFAKVSTFDRVTEEVVTVQKVTLLTREAWSTYVAEAIQVVEDGKVTGWVAWKCDNIFGTKVGFTVTGTTFEDTIAKL